MGLQELSRAKGVTVTDDSTDIRGWRALDAEGQPVGRVDELLFDPGENLVHYVVVAAGDRRVLWPVSRLGFHDTVRTVVLKGLKGRDVALLDSYRGVEGLGAAAAEPTLPLRLELLEERLAITTRPVKVGEVRITRQPVEEAVSEDVTLFQEEVEVSRRLVERPATGDERIRTEGDVTIVPVIVERLVVEKRAFVVEEILIRKQRRGHVEHIHDTVRRDEVRIDDEPIARGDSPAPPDTP